MDIAQLATVHVESGNDRFRIIISDDLSPFLHFRVFSTGYEVDIPLNR